VKETGVEEKVMLCALGMREDGSKEMLSFRSADQEDTDSWRAFLVGIKSRGLQGKALNLITTDANPTLLKAIKDIYPFIKVQRCIVRKLRKKIRATNVLERDFREVRRRTQPMGLFPDEDSAQRIFYAVTTSIRQSGPLFGQLPQGGRRTGTAPWPGTSAGCWRGRCRPTRRHTGTSIALRRSSNPGAGG
jgi:transposase-like protein